MSLKDNLSKFAGKAKDVVDKSGDKIASGVDKARAPSTWEGLGGLAPVG